MAESHELTKKSKMEEPEPLDEAKMEQLSLDEDKDAGKEGPNNNNSAANKSDSTKIDVLLKSTGNAPIMKKKKWAVAKEKKIAGIIEFIKKYLRLEPNESLFIYVNQLFAPSPDQTIENLYECFGSDGKLVLHYCRTPAWG